MDTELIGRLSGALVIVSIIPYSIRTWQKKITPNPTSWLLWTIIAFALFLTYKSSGAKDSIWPAIFGFTNPLLITVLIVIRQKTRFEKITEQTDMCCLIAGIASLIMWAFMRKNPDLAQYALYVAIIADAFAAIPTIVFLWNNPLEDRPFAWGLFSIGYGLSIFAIEENSIANYALPLYMFFGALSVTLILSVYRIRNKIPLKEWG